MSKGCVSGTVNWPTDFAAKVSPGQITALLDGGLLSGVLLWRGPMAFNQGKDDYEVEGRIVLVGIEGADNRVRVSVESLSVDAMGKESWRPFDERYLPAVLASLAIDCKLRRG